MTAMDKITEDISHFIGLFQLTVEEAQLRDAYGDFIYYAPKHHPSTQTFSPDDFEAPFEFVGFDPQVAYKAPAYSSPSWHPTLLGQIQHPPVPVVELNAISDLIDHPKHLLPGAQFTRSSMAREVEPPGSVANYIVQAASLSDDDSFNVGGSGLLFKPQPINENEILKTTEAVIAAAPIDNLKMAGSSEDIIGLINSVAAELKEFAAMAESGLDVSTRDQVFVEQAPFIEGTYVNGGLVAEAPKLSEHFSAGEVVREGEDDRPVEDDDATPDDHDGRTEPNVVVSPDGSITIDDHVDLVAGSNVVVNEAVVNNLWTGSTVTAVVGDHVEINAIIQTNVIQNNDTITSAVNGWTGDGAPDDLFNVATFERTDPSDENTSGNDAGGGFPAAWAVAEIEGDLLIANWLEQYIFVSDNDTGILSSSGVTTKVVAGDNSSVNQVSIYELTMRYDLIVVGGSVHDANIIHQTNVLFDNDVVGAVAGFETTGTGAVSHGSNLLWNEALIRNIGGGDRFSNLPDGYAETAQDFAGGSYQLHGDVLTDPSFAGRGALSVLYVSGDLVNIQYINQTAILGDNDQIALAMDAVKADTDAQWTVETGSNALVNAAAIIDLDSFGRTYVGGEQYSQETLFQAEMITHRPELLGLDPNSLVNEAVLFLDDHMLNSEHQAEQFLPPQYDGHDQHDGLQHVLG